MNSIPYRYSPMQRDITEKMVQELLDQGLIEHSCSLFASLVNL